MGLGKRQNNSTDSEKRWILAWLAIRIMGIACLLLALLFAPFSPVLGVALIIAFMFGSDFALRLKAKLGFRSTLSFAVYACAILVLFALWFFSIISIGGVLVILMPVALGYLVLSYTGKLR